MNLDLSTAVAGAKVAREYMSSNGIRDGWTNAALVDRALARGLTVTATPRGRVRVRKGPRSYWFSGGRTNFNRPLALQMTRYKEVASSLLRARDLYAPRNAVFESGDAERAWRWAEGLVPLVLKPSNANQGKMVHVGITNRSEFVEVFDEISGARGRVLVEEFVPGVEHRVAVVNSRVVAVTRRVPASVEGDGRSSVKELVEEKNSARRNEMNLIHQELTIDSVALRELSRQGLRAESVPDKGQRVLLRATSNIHTGGDAVDATDDLSAAEIRFVERAAKMFAGLRLAGFDLLLPRDGVGERPCVLEINANPMISMHHFPARGRPRDVAGRLLDAMFPTG